MLPSPPHTHAVPLSYHPVPLSGPRFAVLQTPTTLYFSPLNQAQVKLTHLTAPLSLLLPHRVCPSHLPLLRSWPAGSSRGKAEEYRGESTMQQRRGSHLPLGYSFQIP